MKKAFILMVSIIVSILLLEVLLRILPVSLFGTDYEWKRPTLFLQFNDKDGKKYYKTNDIYSASFRIEKFDRVKRKGSLRIFVLGGSAAYGYPFSEKNTFSGILKNMLETHYPNKHIEVINSCGMSYASSRLVSIVHEIVKYEPDHIVLYSGNNEFVERNLYGPERESNILSVFMGYRLIRKVLLPVRDTVDLTNPFISIDVIRKKNIVSRDEMTRVKRNYKHNIEKIIRVCQKSSTGLILMTVPVNVKDWAPGGSVHTKKINTDQKMEWMKNMFLAKRSYRSENYKQAYLVFSKLGKIDPEYAEINFYLGQCALKMGRKQEAAGYFYNANRYDAVPVRAKPGFNNILKDAAREKKVRLIDADKIFRDNSPDSITGSELMFDYCHPNINGHILIARALGEIIIGNTIDMPLLQHPVVEEEDNALYYFAQAIKHEKSNELKQAVNDLKQALQLEPGYEIARYTLGQIYYRLGDRSASISELKRVIRENDANYLSHNLLGNIYLEIKEYEKAETEFNKTIALNPRYSMGYSNLGIIYAIKGRLDRAEKLFEKTIAMDPYNARAHVNLGNLYRDMSKRNSPDKMDATLYQRAIEEYNRAIECDAWLYQAYMNLAITYKETGKVSESRKILDYLEVIQKR